MRMFWPTLAVVLSRRPVADPPRGGLTCSLCPPHAQPLGAWCVSNGGASLPSHAPSPPLRASLGLGPVTSATEPVETDLPSAGARLLSPGRGIPPSLSTTVTTADLNCTCPAHTTSLDRLGPRCHIRRRFAGTRPTSHLPWPFPKHGLPKNASSSLQLTCRWSRTWRERTLVPPPTSGHRTHVTARHRPTAMPCAEWSASASCTTKGGGPRVLPHIIRQNASKPPLSVFVSLLRRRPRPR